MHVDCGCGKPVPIDHENYNECENCGVVYNAAGWIIHTTVERREVKPCPHCRGRMIVESLCPLCNGTGLETATGGGWKEIRTEKDTRSLELAEAAIKAYKETLHEIRLAVDDFLVWADGVAKEEKACLTCMNVGTTHQPGCEVEALRQSAKILGKP